MALESLSICPSWKLRELHVTAMLPATNPVTEGYVVSKRSQVFHRADCKSAAKISETNLVRYNTRDEAKKAGNNPLPLVVPMLYRRFGRTELSMPVLTCGGMRYQYQWQDTPLDNIPADKQANLEATVRRALDLGINHIETARGYGSSERQLGQILPGIPRERIIVQTKIMPLGDPSRFAGRLPRFAGSPGALVRRSAGYPRHQQP